MVDNAAESRMDRIGIQTVFRPRDVGSPEYNARVDKHRGGAGRGPHEWRSVMNKRIKQSPGKTGAMERGERLNGKRRGPWRGGWGDFRPSEQKLDPNWTEQYPGSAKAREPVEPGTLFSDLEEAHRGDPKEAMKVAQATLEAARAEIYQAKRVILIAERSVAVAQRELRALQMAIDDMKRGPMDQRPTEADLANLTAAKSKLAIAKDELAQARKPEEVTGDDVRSALEAAAAGPGASEVAADFGLPGSEAAAAADTGDGEGIVTFPTAPTPDMPAAPADSGAQPREKKAA